MDTEVQVRNKRSRGRGRYGEARLAKRTNGVVCGRSKGVFLPDIQKWVQIDINHPPDVIDGKGLFAFESKYYTKVPASLSKIMSQAVRNAPTGLIPVGVIADRTAHNVYYVLNEADFLGLLIGDANVRE